MVGFAGNKAYYVSSVKFGLVAAKVNTTAYSVGNIRTDGAAAAGSRRAYVCIQAGTTGTGVSLTSTVGAITTDGTVKWQEASGWPVLNGDTVNTSLWSDTKQIAVSLGHVIMNTAKTRVAICRIAGTATLSSEPTFSLGSDTVDGTVTWFCIATAAYASWSCPAETMGDMVRLFAPTFDDPTTNVFVGSDHNGSTPNTFAGGATPQGVNFTSVGYGNVPPLNSDVTAGAVETYTTGATDCWNFAPSTSTSKPTGVFSGITFKSSSNSAGTTMNFGANVSTFLENCKLWKAGNGSAGAIGASAGLTLIVELKNTVFKFGATTDQISFGSGFFTWRDTLSAIDLTGSVPTTLFNPTAVGVFVKGVDLSGITGTILATNASGQWLFENCKLNPSVTTVGGNPGRFGRVRFVRCSNGTNRGYSEIWDYYGRLITKTDVVRTGGAVVSAQSISWLITTTANISLGSDFRCLPLQIANTKTGSSSTATMYGIINAAALPTNADIYMDTTYLGDAAVTEGYSTSSRAASVLAAASNLTADTSAWDSGILARANTHAYVTGDIIKVASNPGRIFFCTSGGTSAGSEPVGYASAVDGGSVTDSGATFRAGVRFSWTTTFTAQLTGLLAIVVRAAKVSTSWYIDPFINVA